MPKPRKGIANGKNILVFYSSKNVKGKHDSSGAFHPEARKFAKLHGVPKENLIGINCIKTMKSKRRAQVYQALNRQQANSIVAIAFFMHGWENGIQCGIGTGRVPKLCSVMAGACKPNVKVMLYACLTAENDVRDKVKAKEELGPATDGGFADELRDAMYRFGMERGWVDAHKTAGHTDWNPYGVRFRCDAVMDELYGAVGGFWLVQPGSDLWRKWLKRLKGKTGFRYRYPFMSQMEIIQELTA